MFEPDFRNEDNKMLDEELIEFHVGGSGCCNKYTTSLSTIKKWGGKHYLAHIVDSVWAERVDKRKPIFVDRNPEYFGVILDYFRKSKINFFRDQTWLKNILDEAEYFGIVPLIDEIHEELRHLERQEIKQAAARMDERTPTTMMRSRGGTPSSPHAKQEKPPAAFYEGSLSFSQQRTADTPRVPAPRLDQIEAARTLYNSSLINDLTTPPQTPRTQYDLGKMELVLNEDF